MYAICVDVTDDENIPVIYCYSSKKKRERKKKRIK